MTQSLRLKGVEKLGCCIKRAVALVKYALVAIKIHPD